jgi:hypothetical protein
VLLGNTKPKCLHHTENALWSVLFNIAGGLDQGDEFSNFFQQLDEMEAIGEPLHADCFVESLCFSSRLSLDVSINSKS